MNERTYNRDELLNLSGQILNGMFSADSSMITKLFDRTIHKWGVADVAVDIAARVLDKIDTKVGNINKI